MDDLKSCAVVSAIPFVCTWRFLLSCFTGGERQKPWRRVICDAAFRWVVANRPVPRTAHFLGSTEDIYTKWAKQRRLPTHSEDIGENAKLFWILNGGEWDGRVPERVILYLHGGGFSLPLSSDAASFWRYVQNELKSRHDLDVGVAILDYTLVPEAHFPIPLIQSVKAVQHLLSNGLKPSNILLTGDSAGANLVLQLLSHILHPQQLPSVPPLHLPSNSNSGFAGAYLMSPWVTLFPRDVSSSYAQNANWDIISPTKIVEFGLPVLAGFKRDIDLRYIDLCLAPSGWFASLDTVIEKILITAGGKECMRDDIVSFGERLTSPSENIGKNIEVKMVVDKCGVHDDPFFDFLAGGRKMGELTPMIVLWCRDAFAESIS